MGSSEPNLIFLLSLPRAGSTLLQRLIATHPQVATTSEPWLLLAQLFPFFNSEIYTTYRNVDFQIAAQDFFQNLPGGELTYWKEVGVFIRNVYNKSCNGKRYFLDKTPRYHSISRDLSRIFPYEKYIILFRNPLALIASINQTWGDGKWKLYTYKADLYSGLMNLLDTYEALDADNKCLTLRYEDLVTDPDSALAEIFAFLELEFCNATTNEFHKISLNGHMGDPKMKAFTKINQNRATAWKNTSWNIFRKIWAHCYLDWIGKERLALMGYSLEELKDDLRKVPLSWRYLASDLIRFVLGGVYNFFDPVIFRDKLRKIKTPWKISALR